jgi:branched-chain amino acid transport system permease protein
MGQALALWLGQAVNGLVLGSVYALLAAGISLVFGAAGTVNFAQGSAAMLGSYAAWAAVALLGWPLWAALPAAAAAGALLGLAVERFAVRPFRDSGPVAPLLSTIGAGMVIDSLAEIVFGPNPKSFPAGATAHLAGPKLKLGYSSLGPLDALVVGSALACSVSLYLFLRGSRAGRALRASAQDADAARAMGVRVERVEAMAFALSSALGALAGALIGLYYNILTPSSGFQAGLKGFTACVLGGLGSVPASMGGGLVLGLLENLGVSAFGAQARGLVAYALLLGALFLRPQGIFGGAPARQRESLSGSFIPRGRKLSLPRPAALALVLAAFALPLALHSGYVLQVLTGAWILGLFAMGLSFVAGSSGLMSLGQAGLMAIGGYASGLLTLRAGLPFWLAFPIAGLAAAAIGSLLVFPALRLRGHYVAIATLGLGEIANQAILNWSSLTGGAMGLAGIPAPRLFGLEIASAPAYYYLALSALAIGGAILGAAQASPLGRTLRALRDDEPAARSLGIGARRYRALAFALGAFFTGLAGSLSAHLYTYLSHETFNSALSIQGVAMVVLGGLGNLWGAVLGALALSALPELLRFAELWRWLLYGLVLVAALRWRPQGLLGSE